MQKLRYRCDVYLLSHLTHKRLSFFPKPPSSCKWWKSNNSSERACDSTLQLFQLSPNVFTDAGPEERFRFWLLDRYNDTHNSLRDLLQHQNAHLQVSTFGQPSAPTIHHVLMPGRGGGGGGGGPPRRHVRDSIRPIRLTVALGLKIDVFKPPAQKRRPGLVFVTDGNPAPPPSQPEGTSQTNSLSRNTSVIVLLQTNVAAWPRR